ncbi:ABC transporter permease [Halobacteriovorax marinus]|uniref:ABC transporter permease n=1 Tax=Halobacteriovorax marinus TaxID=97084 RepID=UPI003A92E074
MKSLTVAKYTFSEFVQSKILYNVFFLSLGLLLMTYVASEFTYGVPNKVALDFGLGASSISTLLISIFLGANLIVREVENRTLYMIISRPISRVEFMLGKIIGLIGIVFINTLILGGVSLSLYFFMGGAWNSLIPFAFFFIILESIIVLLVVILFSLVTNTILAVVNTIVVYTTSYAIFEVGKTTFANNNLFFKKMIAIGNYLLPSLSNFNIKDYILYEKLIPYPSLGYGVIYGVSYVLFLLFICILIFNQKNLD